MCHVSYATLRVLGPIFVLLLAVSHADAQGSRDLPRVQTEFFRHYNAGRYREAEPLGKQLLAITEQFSRNRPLDIAAACNNLANVYGALGRYSEAIPLHQRALPIRRQTLGDAHPLVAESYGNLGVAYLYHGQMREAETHLKQSLAIHRQRSGPVQRDVAAALNNLGVLYFEECRFGEAAEYYQQALRMKQQLFPPEHEEIALAHGNLAGVYHAMDRLDEAERLFRHCVTVREKRLHNNHPDLASAYENLGVLCRDRGRWSEAEKLIRRALQIRQDVLGPDHLLVGQSLNNLAIVYADQQRLAEAEKLYRRSLMIRQERLGPNHPDVTASLNNLAVLYKRQSRYQEAEPLFERMLAAMGDDAGRSRHRAIVLSNLASLYEVQGELGKAAGMYRETLEIWQRQSGPASADVAQGLNNLANVHRRLGEMEQAKSLIDRAIEIRESSGSSGHHLHYSYRLRAQIFQALGETEQAAADLKRAIELAEQQRGRISGDAWDQGKAFADYHAAYEQMIALQAERGNLATVVQTAERWRARSLADQLERHEVDLLARVPNQQADELRRRYDQARQQVATVEAQIRRLHEQAGLSSDERSRRLGSLESELFAARQLAVRCFGDIQTAARELTGSAVEPDGDALLDALQSVATRTRSLVLYYLIGTDASFVLSIAADESPTLDPLVLDDELAGQAGVKAGPLTLVRLEEYLKVGDRQVLQLLADPGRNLAATERLHGLWQLLIPPSRRDALCGGAYRRLVVVPDGPLFLLPFDALVTDPAGTRYLLDAGPPVCYAPSATVLMRLADATGRPTSSVAPVLTVGDANYQAVSADTSREATGLRERLEPGQRYVEAAGGLEQLPFSGLESTWVAEIFQKYDLPATALRAGEATEANLRKQMPGRRIIHLACHGFSDDMYGNFFGALAVSRPPAGKATPDDDGFLTLAEIYELDLRGCELAILSACRTNYGPQQAGEGVWALSRGFLVAGARRVVASNWLVDDEAAASLISYFCAGIAQAEKKGENPDYAAALQRAKRWVRQQDKWQGPYYWATFALVGPG